MIVQCHHCNSRYKVNDAKIPPKGRQIRCLKCSEIFFIKPAENDAKPHVKKAWVTTNPTNTSATQTTIKTPPIPEEQPPTPSPRPPVETPQEKIPEPIAQDQSAAPIQEAIEALQNPKPPQEASPPPIPDKVPLSQAFYRKVVLLSTVKHKEWILASHRPYHYAASTHAILLNGEEFRPACLNYPIVFLVDPPHHPIAILGLQNEENLFVDPNGAWLEEAYVPLYVQRYPFALHNPPGSEQLHMCIDSESDFFNNGTEGSLLLDASGAPTPVLIQEMEICRKFHTQSQVTAEFVTALMTHNMLSTGSIDLKDNTNVFRITDFMVLNEAKLATLEEATIINWHRKGWLAWIHWCLASQNHWNKLLNLKKQREKQA
ncbi:MAG: zinc-ribbon domain-containing protein [Magnetococcus sp. DMHC-6]